MSSSGELNSIKDLTLKLEFQLKYNVRYSLFFDYTCLVIALTLRYSLNLSLFENDKLNIIGWTVLGSSVFIGYCICMGIIKRFTGKSTIQNNITYYKLFVIFMFTFSIIWISIGIYQLSERLNEFESRSSIPRNLTICYFVLLITRTISVAIGYLIVRRSINRRKRFIQDRTIPPMSE